MQAIRWWFIEIAVLLVWGTFVFYKLFTNFANFISGVTNVSIWWYTFTVDTQNAVRMYVSRYLYITILKNADWSSVKCLKIDRRTQNPLLGRWPLIVPSLINASLLRLCKHHPWTRSTTNFITTFALPKRLIILKARIYKILEKDQPNT